MDITDGMSERGFQSLRVNARQPKPRTRGVTEIRGPYYTPMGKRYLADVLETMANTWTPSSSPAGRSR